MRSEVTSPIRLPWGRRLARRLGRRPGRGPGGASRHRPGVGGVRRRRGGAARVSAGRRLGGLLDAAGELGDLVEGGAALGHLLADLAVGAHDRGVVAPAELPADLGQGEVGQLAAQVHGHVAHVHEGLLAALVAQVVDGHAEVVGRLRHDEGRGDLLPGGVGDDVLEDHLRQGPVDGLLVERGEGADADEGALEFADVGGHPGGDVLQDVHGQVQAVGAGLAGKTGKNYDKSRTC